MLSTGVNRWIKQVMAEAASGLGTAEPTIVHHHHHHYGSGYWNDCYVWGNPYDRCYRPCSAWQWSSFKPSNVSCDTCRNKKDKEKKQSEEAQRIGVAILLFGAMAFAYTGYQFVMKYNRWAAAKVATHIMQTKQHFYRSDVALCENLEELAHLDEKIQSRKLAIALVYAFNALAFVISGACLRIGHNQAHIRDYSYKALDASLCAIPFTLLFHGVTHRTIQNCQREVMKVGQIALDRASLLHRIQAAAKNAYRKMR